MAIASRIWVVGTNTGSSATVSADTTSGTGTTPQTGDLCVVIYCNDYYALSNMGTPSVTAGSSFTLTAVTNGTADNGNLNAHVKCYTGTVAANGHFTISATESGSADEEKSILVWVLSGADTATPIDGGSSGAANNVGTSTASQDAPSVTPSGSDAFLICHVNSGTGAAAASYTHPTGMTELTEIHVGGLSGDVAYLQLAASGATGTKTFTASTATPYAAVSLAIKTASSGAITATPTGIGSAEAFGTPTAVLDINGTPTGIASAEAFGAVTAVLDLNVTPNGIASAEAFGTPVAAVSGGIAGTPAGIGSAETFGSPTAVLTLAATPTSVDSAEAFGTPTVVAGGLRKRLKDVYRIVSYPLAGDAQAYSMREGLTAYGNAAPLTVKGAPSNRDLDGKTYVFRGGYVHESEDPTVIQLWIDSGFEVEDV